MIFALKRPCIDCPFLTKMDYRLCRERAEGIVHEIADCAWFPCHKTCEVDEEDNRFAGDRAQFCAGTLIIAEKTNQKGAAMQIGHRLGHYDPSLLHLDAPVFETFEQWIEAQAR